MIQTTLWLMIKDWKIFLWEKKRWFAKWVLNWIWGKVDWDESLDNCLIREAKEEIWIEVEEFEKIWEMNFYFEKKPEWNQVVHLYKISKYSWEIIESDEIRPFWFDLDKIPYGKMWDADKIRLPRILNWEKEIVYDFYYDDENWVYNDYKKIK